LPRFKSERLSTLLLYVCALFDFEEMELTGSLRRSAGLLNALNQLVDALTGLERILTTPIPYSCVPRYVQICRILTGTLRYSIHLWAVTLLYCFFLVRYLETYARRVRLTDERNQPFQLWPTLRYLTIPGTIVSVCAPLE